MDQEPCITSVEVAAVPRAPRLDVAKKTQLLFSPEAPEQHAGARERWLPERGMPTLATLQRRDTARRCPHCGRQFSGDEPLCPFDGSRLIAEPAYNPGADPLIGCTLEQRYKVEEVIAEGGMGTVYRVRHTKLNSAFAMKVLRRDLAEDDTIADRLIEEARATAAIGHPNIVAAADFGEIDSEILPALGKLKLPFFVMEHLDGYTLAELIADAGALEPARVVNIVSQTASALAAAHRAGIIHRDLKPDNIRLVRDEAGNELAKVVDFGVAKVIGASKKTQPGIVFGTPHYMSPEQGQGDPLDHRTDIYSLGVIIYECLSGEVPFVGDTFVGVITKHIHTAPPPLAKALREQQLGSVMARCLEKRPSRRFDAMTDIVSALQDPAMGAGASERSRWASQVPGEGRSPWVWLAGALGVVVMVIALSVGVISGTPTAPSTDVPEAVSANRAQAAQSTSSTRAPRPIPSRHPVSSRPVSSNTTAPVAPAVPLPTSPSAPTSRRKDAPPPSKPKPKPAGDVVDPWG